MPDLPATRALALLGCRGDSPWPLFSLWSLGVLIASHTQPRHQSPTVPPKPASLLSFLLPPATALSSLESKQLSGHAWLLGAAEEVKHSTHLGHTNSWCPVPPGPPHCLLAFLFFYWVSLRSPQQLFHFLLFFKAFYHNLNCTKIGQQNQSFCTHQSASTRIHPGSVFALSSAQLLPLCVILKPASFLTSTPQNFLGANVTNALSLTAVTPASPPGTTRQPPVSCRHRLAGTCTLPLLTLLLGPGGLALCQAGPAHLHLVVSTSPFLWKPNCCPFFYSFVRMGFPDDLYFLTHSKRRKTFIWLKDHHSWFHMHFYEA